MTIVFFIPPLKVTTTRYGTRNSDCNPVTAAKVKATVVLSMLVLGVKRIYVDLFVNMHKLCTLILRSTM